ncbi:MAG TPA: UDP-2,3-diacylglucosamine diphosphatase, partial [Roseiarcus sp.]|nr:UDP-2,3-diacylglucosamine diphosphatase [Roseiarcus sp.]
FGYWSFSAWAKLRVKNAVNFIGAFERELAAEAKKRGVDGVICGHIHHPAIRDIDGVTYVNTGDFVESCSLVVENDDGALEVVYWSKPRPSADSNEAEAETADTDSEADARAKAAA